MLYTLRLNVYLFDEGSTIFCCRFCCKMRMNVISFGIVVDYYCNDDNCLEMY